MKRTGSWLLAGLATVGLLLGAGSARANNLHVTNVTVFARDSSTAYVKFDISWENSWRYATVNHDAAWVFFKVLPEGSSNWLPVRLEGSGTNPVDYVTGTAGTLVEIVVPTDRVGLFIRRSSEGSGTTSVQNIKAVWNFASNSLASTAKVRVQAEAIEMVYVAQGAYSLGSGGTETGHFYAPDGTAQTTNTFLVSSEAAITVANSGGSLYYVNVGGSVGDGTGTISNAFPKGYAAFYCMKYEITQGQYCDFLNTLTATQAGNLIPSNTYRNTIGGSYPAFTVTAPDRACNWLFWAQGCAYADWAGLRPMSELEYEKACRGPATPVANEYAWGSTSITSLTGESGTPGSGTETPSPSSANCYYINWANGPTRVGIFATASSSRQQAGATYWGIMEMSGNLYERAVWVGNSTGRAFTGLHGDGVLAVNGSADVSGWPGTDSGTQWRGGCWVDGTADRARVSDRYGAAASAYGSRYGWRGVRTAP